MIANLLCDGDYCEEQKTNLCCLSCKELQQCTSSCGVLESTEIEPDICEGIKEITNG